MKQNSDHQKRGKPIDEWILRYTNSNEPLCLSGLMSDEPQERSAAALALSPKSKIIVTTLCETLKKESCLYTRIAICETLSKGNRDTAHWMCPYLGEVGHNQHKILPKRSSLKKSYPLPRDLIARTLGKMDVVVLPELIHVLKTGTQSQKREVLDAIGFLLFYHPEAAIDQVTGLIIDILLNEEDEILTWKSIMVCSALPDQKIIDVLQQYRMNSHELLRDEAQKSLSQLMNRTNIIGQF